MRSKKTNKSAGFTLIELLIVIIIIGILAAIAFVAYSGSQNSANQADAEATLSQSRSKLGEYNANNGYYPDTLGTFTTWLDSDAGGNNTAMSEKLTDGDYTYAADDGAGGACDNAGTPCTAYTLTAAGSMFGGDDIEVTN